MSPSSSHLENGNLRIDVVEDVGKVVISIVENNNHGGAVVTAIELDFTVARIVAHYLLEHVA